jgi:hypothetical protein
MGMFGSATLNSGGSNVAQPQDRSPRDVETLLLVHRISFINPWSFSRSTK